MARPAIDWLITDTHWYHGRMVELCGRPADHTERSVTALCQLLQPQDRLFHLGDVILYQMKQLATILSSIPGQKILLMGNHDRKSQYWYMRNGFAWATEMLVIGDVLLSHKPVQQLPSGVRLNVHGHWHNSRQERPDWWTTETHRILALEDTDYQPVKLLEFVK